MSQQPKLRSIQIALRESAALGMLKSGVMEFFGKGRNRKQKLKEFDAIGCSLLVHSLGSLSRVMPKTLIDQSVRCLFEGQNEHIRKQPEFDGLMMDVVDEVLKQKRLQTFDALGLAQILHGFSMFTVSPINWKSPTQIL